MTESKCPICGKGTLVEKVKKEKIFYQGKKYYIPDIKVIYCSECSEEMITAQEIRKMEKIAKQKSNDKKNLRGRPLGKEKLKQVNSIRMTEDEFKRHNRVQQFLKKKLLLNSSSQTFLFCEKVVDLLMQKKGQDAVMEILINSDNSLG